MKRQLFDAIAPLSDAGPLEDRKRIKKIIEKLKSPQVEIPENDYEHIIDFAFLLTKEMPSILENPNNAALKKFILQIMLEQKNSNATNSRPKRG